MTWSTVEVGPDGVELLLPAELIDPGLELVHATGEGPGFRRVPSGAVTPGQLVEMGEMGPGVAHVTADGAIRPSEPVGVEAQVQVHEFRDGVDVLGRVPQGLHALTGHAGADHLVVMEGDPTLRDRTVRGLPTSWNRAARRSSRSGEVLSTTANV